MKTFTIEWSDGVITTSKGKDIIDAIRNAGDDDRKIEELVKYSEVIK